MKKNIKKRKKIQNNIRRILFGIATYVPGYLQIKDNGTGGTNSARYCYSVWLRHIVMARQNGIKEYPKVIAELGPGDSLGIGLAGLLSGCRKYFAFDLVKYTDIETNIAIFEKIIKLYQNKTPIPGDNEFPDIEPKLKNYDFPREIIDDVRMKNVLDKTRIEKIRESIRDYHNKNSMVQYKVPWNNYKHIKHGFVDMIYSQAVLEHVEDLQDTYAFMFKWLSANGFISHTIDFRCHGTADVWNGHWTYSDIVWKIIKGKRKYLINRVPHSEHISIIEGAGFKILCDQKTMRRSKLSVDRLAPQFRRIPKTDLVTCGTFIQAVKKTNNRTQQCLWN